MLKKTMHLAMLAAVGAFAMPTLAHATLITTTTNGFSLNASVTDKLGANKSSSDGATTQTNVNLGTTTLGRFDSSKGVLTGVNVGLASTYKQTASVTAPSTSAGNNMGNANAVGTGSSAVRLTVPTNVTGAAANLSATDNCGAKPKDGCNNGATSATLNHNLSVGSANLNDYVGPGTVNVNHTATTLKAETTANGFNSEATTTSTIDWFGSLTASYSYLEHASQSFDPWGNTVMNLNFGSVYQGDTVADLVFFIHNLAGDRVGLTMTGISESGDSSNRFTTNVANFGTLAAGASYNYGASFLTDMIGSFGAIYEFTFADAAPDGAFATSTLGSGYKLTLNLSGSVVERPADPADVPEPASLMLLGLGAAAMGLRRKRKA
ncbi:choice-of-anchor E domain-containing protein [Massilia sp. ST3]|uniref:choice-of-anchor E domain-containing protein n=1 Tax=Massilia sp. ST3 TaxID=2824903 RepID=UPI001B8360EC|nr:choice-of-anchor E domain-containing protein [Massilia sp. ST3]MBQ5949729.1 PEP-CTERM sorting domain-containing protein [Massilia sp. ST3]